MARIRTIKPEFWTSSQVAECSPTARLMFVGMWTFADDAGNQRADPKRLKMEVFPGDAFDNEQMLVLIAELISQELIVEYEAEGGVFWHITGFRSHQKIDKPSYKFPEYSENGRRPFDDRSTTSTGTLDDSSPPEGSLMESNGMESKVKKSAARADPHLLAIIGWWNELATEVDLATAKTEPIAQSVAAGWKRVEKSPELRGYLADLDAIAAEIRQSEFVRSKRFLTLAKLLGAKNHAGEYIVEQLLNGAYRDAKPAKPKPGDPNWVARPLTKAEIENFTPEGM